MSKKNGIVPAFILTILGIVSYFIGQKLVVLPLIAIGIVYITGLILQIRRYNNEVKYKESIIEINKLTNDILNINLFKSKKENIKTDFLIDCCNKISEIFNTITKDKDCCVTIKVYTQDRDKKNGVGYVETVARTKSKLEERPNREKDIKIDNEFGFQMHFDNNEDLKHIFESWQLEMKKETIDFDIKSSLSFFSNDLTSRFGYENTSIRKSYKDKINKEKSKRKRKKIMNKEWPLPYKSTIVLPLISENHLKEQYNLEGIICIDSNEKNVFDQKIDVDILSMISINIAQKYSLLKNAS